MSDTEPGESNWISPREASRRVTLQAGYVVTPDDIKQLRRTGKIKHIQKINERIDLYCADEIASLQAPNKRIKIPADQWEQVIEEIKHRRRIRDHKEAQ